MMRRISLKRFALPKAVLVVIAVCVFTELVIQFDNIILGGAGHLRRILFAVGSFRADLVSATNAIFDGQAFTMFLTYMFLHVGPVHLLINMAGLAWLGRLVWNQRPMGDIVIFYIMSGIGAAMVFAFFGPAHTELVGASGALFGLLGVYGVDSGLFWTDGKHTLTLLRKLFRIVVIAAALVLSDMFSHVAIGTKVAWQAHTGGFLTGGVIALIWPRLSKGNGGSSRSI